MVGPTKFGSPEPCGHRILYLLLAVLHYMDCAITQLRLEGGVHQSAQAAVMRVSHAQVKLGIHSASGKGRMSALSVSLIHVNAVRVRALRSDLQALRFDRRWRPRQGARAC